MTAELVGKMAMLSGILRLGWSNGCVSLNGQRRKGPYGMPDILLC